MYFFLLACVSVGGPYEPRGHLSPRSISVYFNWYQILRLASIDLHYKEHLPIKHLIYLWRHWNSQNFNILLRHEFRNFTYSVQVESILWLNIVQVETYTCYFCISCSLYVRIVQVACTSCYLYKIATCTQHI